MDYKILKKENLYKGFFQLNKYTLRNQLFGGGESEPYSREIFDRGNAAAVLLIDSKLNKLVMVEQFRPGAINTEFSPWLMETVAGIIETGESPEEVVIREALEESGTEIMRLRKICEYFVSPGGSTERIWLYIGEVDSGKAAEFAGLDEENEDIKVHCIDIDLALNWLDSGIFNNAMSIIAMQWLKLTLLSNKSLWD
jgi:ADP-ribose pyrophosphatase